MAQLSPVLMWLIKILVDVRSVLMVSKMSCFTIKLSTYNTLTDLAGKVGNMNTSERSCQSITVSWDEPDNVSTPIEYYVATSVPPTVGTCGQQRCNVSATQTLLTKLVYGVLYNISVAACNCAGCGPSAILHDVGIGHIDTIGKIITD